MIETKLRVRDIVKEFSEYVKSNDIERINDLLSDDGVFDIDMGERDAKEVGKQEFLFWFRDKLEQTAINSVEFDQCLFCKIGNPVVFFNGGKFPRKAYVGEKPKSGLMLNVNEDNQIDQIQFCFTFLHSDNKHKPNINAENIIESMKNGLSAEEAFDRLKKRVERSNDSDLPF